MTSLFKIFCGLFVVSLVGFVGVVAVPYVQLSSLQPQVNEDEGTSLPPPQNGLAKYGAEVYQTSGCAYCHTQQVRPVELGSDIARGWGKRHTVARDYIYERPVLLGFQRLGPDLSNEGMLDAEGKPLKSKEWHYQHLLNPKSVVPWSVMPAHKFLFTTRKIYGQISDEALDLKGQDAPPEGYETVPTYEARALVAYLMSLNKNYALKEVPLPKEAK